MKRPRKVLIAEDNRVLANVLLFNLERAGFEVKAAHHGVLALQCLNDEPFDALVTDFEMPGLNGEQLCYRVRNELGLAGLQVVMCSARGLEINREELIAKFNIAAFLFKPFSIRKLLEILQAPNQVPSEAVNPQYVPTSTLESTVNNSLQG